MNNGRRSTTGTSRIAWLRSESYRSGIINSSIFNFIAKGLAFAVSIVLAYLYGTRAKTDVFFYA